MPVLPLNNPRWIYPKDMTDLPEMDESTRTEVEAAVYRKMVEHFRNNPEVQNIDLMNLAYFCRNCLSRWYMTAAEERGVELDTEQARAIVYGMPFAEYKSRHQEKASPEQLARFEQSKLKETE